MIRYFLYVSLLFVTVKYDLHKLTSVRFNGIDWIFPISVGDAMKRYNLSYKPPGYYFTEDSIGNKVNLEYTYQTNDFTNEHQAKEKLYNRKVHSYVHTFTYKPKRIDSLRLMLENQFGKKFVMLNDTQRLGFTSIPANLKINLPEAGIITYGLMQVDSILAIGIRNKPTLTKDAIKSIEVLIFYNLPKDRIVNRMLSY